MPLERNDTRIPGFASVWFLLVLAASTAASFKSMGLTILILALGICGNVVVNRLNPVARSQFRPGVIDVVIAAAIIIEILLYHFSSFRFNSRPFLLLVLATVGVYYFIRGVVLDDRIFEYTAVAVSLFGLYWALKTIISAHQMAADISVPGFGDLTLFRNAYTPLVGSNEWVVFLFLFMPFSTALLTGGSSRIARGTGALTAFFLTIAIMLSFSRGGYAGLAVFVAGIVAGVIVLRLVPFKSLLIGVMLLGGAIAIAMYGHRDAVISTLKMHETVSQTRSTESRFRMWEVAGETFSEMPITGAGMNTFALEYNARHRRSSDEAPFGRVTSALTQVLAEKGVMGLAVVTAVFILLTILGLRFVFRKAEVGPIERAFAVSTLAIMPALVIRELTMSTLLHREFIYYFFALVFSLFTVITGRNMEWTLRGRLAPLCFVPSLVLLIMVTTHKLSERRLFKVKARVNKQVERGISRGDLKDVALLKTLAPWHPVPLIHESAITAQCPFSSTITWANIFQCPGDPFHAIVPLERAFEIESRDETLLFAVAFHQAVNGDWDTAIRHFKAAEEVDPTVHVYPLVLGMAIEKRDGITGQAIAAYARALALDPDLCLSRFYDDLSERDPLAARSAFKGAVEGLHQQEPSAVILARLGACYFFAGDHERALEYLGRASHDLPGMNRPYFYMGAIRLTLGDTVSAIALWDKSRYLDQGDLMVLSSFHRLGEAASIPNSELQDAEPGEHDLAEPMYWKRGVFYPRFRAEKNTVLSPGFMEYLRPVRSPLEGLPLATAEQTRG